MDKKKIEIKDAINEKECCCTGECKKRKTWLFLIIVIVLLGIAFLGGMFVGKEYFDDGNCVIIDKVENEDNADEDVEEDYLDDNFYTNEHFSDDYDKFILEYSLGLDDESIEKFIASSDRDSGTSDYLVGAIYEEQPSMDFKVAYVLREIVGNQDYGSGEFTVSKKMLETAISKVFADYKISDLSKVSEDLYYKYIGYSLQCDTEKCNVSFFQGGGTGPCPLYVTKIQSVSEQNDEIVYTIKVAYADYDYENNTDIYTILSKKGGEKLCDIAIDEYDGYDSVLKCALEKNLYTYELSFDKNYKFIGSKQV